MEDYKDYYERLKQELEIKLYLSRLENAHKMVSLYKHCYSYDNSILDFVNELIETGDISNIEFAYSILQENKK